MLGGQNKLARTSSTPGRTRLLNLFNFNGGLFTLVDLPGYGYAAAARTKIDTWSRLIEDYFSLTKKLLHVFWLLDIRHEPTKLDKQMLKFLFANNFGFTVVATKPDKIKKSEIPKNVQMIASALGLGKDNIIPVSGETKEGKARVLKRLNELLYFD
jgi:GTP-binding protein